MDRFDILLKNLHEFRKWVGLRKISILYKRFAEAIGAAEILVRYNLYFVEHWQFGKLIGPVFRSVQAHIVLARFVQFFIYFSILAIKSGQNFPKYHSF